MGMVEMGMSMSYDQLVIDAEIVRMNKRVEQGIPVNPDTLAVELINGIGPGGNYLAEDHTIRYMRQEGSMTKLFDRRMMDAWKAEGATDLPQRAHKKALDIYEHYRIEPLSAAVDQAIEEITVRAEKNAE